jgi:hypothetical protein
MRTRLPGTTGTCQGTNDPDGRAAPRITSTANTLASRGRNAIDWPTDLFLTEATSAAMAVLTTYINGRFSNARQGVRSVR